MDRDDGADLYAILGLAGIGVALMLVGSLDPGDGTVILAVIVPSLAAVLAAALAAVCRWYGAACRPASRRGGRSRRRDRGSTGGRSRI